MTKINIFKPPEDIEAAGSVLANHMPEGRAFGKKCTDGSVMKGLITGLASVFLQVQEQIFELANQYDINLTVDFLPEWETSVGIPDECIFQFKTLEERRERVIQRLKKIPLVTIEELQGFVNAFFPDEDINLRPYQNESDFEFDFEFTFLGDINEKFLIFADIVLPTPDVESEFEYTFEFDFGGGPNTDLLKCLLKKVLPANIILIINFLE